MLGHEPFETTEEKKQNLIKLANYLLNLPDDYEEFDMSYFCYNPVVETVFDPAVITLSKGCGAVACAVGHAPSAGIPAFKNENWWDYSSRVLIDSDSLAWTWCFSGDWNGIDNTPKGAAKRILYLLDKGVPDNWWEQIKGIEGLSYVD